MAVIPLRQQPETLLRFCEQLAPLGVDSLPGPAPFLSAASPRVGAIRCPFPVDSPHEIRPDLIKLGASDPFVIVDRQAARWKACLSKKLGRLTSAHAFVYSEDFTTEDLGFWSEQVRNALCTFLPHGPVSASGALPWIGREVAADPIDFFLGLTASLQEDFVLMAPRDHRRSLSGDDNPLIARLLSVCFPSGWAPEEKCDQSLFAIHTPVADNDRIQKAAGALSAAMAQKGPFVRYVYTLTPDAGHWRDPGHAPWQDFGGLSDLWFRVERQVTIPLRGIGSLFLIRLFVVPLPEMLTTPGRAMLLADAIETMSPALRAYKGLDRIAPRLIRALRDHAASGMPPLLRPQP